MITQTSKYAILAMSCLAHHYGKPLTCSQIAMETGIQPVYLAKVLQSLRQAKLVVAKRGRGGGYMLIENPAEVTMSQIIAAVQFQPVEFQALSQTSMYPHMSRCISNLMRAIESADNALYSQSIESILNNSGDFTIEE